MEFYYRGRGYYIREFRLHYGVRIPMWLCGVSKSNEKKVILLIHRRRFFFLN